MADYATGEEETERSEEKETFLLKKRENFRLTERSNREADEYCLPLEIKLDLIVIAVILLKK
ncbi:MAG: hypothetical protein IPL22_18975 [Bacteroidetes bacterium]|nr:hypothetical protein [Bacteroidota bacterium]